MAFQQGRSNSCVFSSASSAFAAVGYPEAAAALEGHIAASAKDPNPMELLLDVVRSRVVPELMVQRAFKRFKLNPLADVSPHPTTVQLIGSEGGVGHAVTIVGEWIFDATQPHALPLTRASLDFCCSTAGVAVAYVGVLRAVRFMPQPISAKRQKVAYP